MNRIVKKYSKPGRWEVEIPFEQTCGETEWIGLLDARAEGKYELNVVSNHKVMQTKGRITVRAVVGSHASVVINGLIKIAKEAQETDAFLEIRVLLLDLSSIAIADPKLEIEANDVKASHAASVGQVDSEQVLFLMSRGLTRSQATEQIVSGWLSV